MVRTERLELCDRNNSSVDTKQNSTMRLMNILLILLLCIVSTTTSEDLTLSVTGMTVLKAIYGASCGAGAAVADDEALITDYVKALCDGRPICSGIVDADIVNRDISSCAGDFHVVAVCENGEIRSLSIDGEATGKDFHIDCSSPEIPVARQHPDWMAQMENILVNKTIKELHLPGTHHSGTSSFNMFLYHLAKCQNTRVGQQLIAGVRYLDYRVGAIDGVYGARVIHGVFYGHHFLGDLLEIWAFSRLHPREFFIVDLQHTSSLTRAMQRQLVVWLHALFHHSAITRWSVSIINHSMRDVWASGRQILMLQDDPRSFLAWGRRVLYASWPNVCTGETLQHHAETQMALLPQLHNKLVMLQWLITVKFQCLTSLYGRTMDIREEGMQWLLNHTHGFTIVLTDFTLQPLDREGILELIINSNMN